MDVCLSTPVSNTLLVGSYRPSLSDFCYTLCRDCNEVDVFRKDLPFYLGDLAIDRKLYTGDEFTTIEL